MPRYVIERQYLVPMFEHILVEAPTFDDACREALDDTVHPWGEEAKLCFDDARPVTIAYAVELPDSFQLRTDDAYGEPLSSLLFDGELDPLPIPPEFAFASEEPKEDVGFV